MSPAPVSRSVGNGLACSLALLATLLGTAKMILVFYKWGKQEGGLASQQTPKPVPG